MARKYLTPIDLNGNVLFNAALHPQGSAPSINATGQVWYDSTNKIVKIYDGGWNPVGGAIASTGGPTVTPSSIGSFYFDTTALDLYVANGTSSSANWKPAASGALIPLNSLGAMTSNKDLGATYTLQVKTPSSATDVVNKAYVDTIATGINAHDAVSYASTTVVAGTYSNGTAGVTATIIGTGTLTIDGYSVQNSDAGTNVQGGTGLRVLLKDQTLTDQNGIYVVTACVAGTSWTLTRAYDYDTVGEISAGDFAFVNLGSVNAKLTYIQTSKPVAISGIGTTANAIAFTLFANGNISGVVSINQGGTGATTAALARTALSAASSGANSDITSITGLTTALAVGQGGTGSTTAALARTALSAAVSGTNGDITSLTGLTTALSLGQGGTGATTAALAATALGVGTGSSPTHAGLTLTGLTGYLYANASSVVTAATTIPFSGVSATTATITGSTGLGTFTKNIAQKVTAKITGDGATTDFTVTHTLNATNSFASAQIFDTNGLQVECDVTHTATTTKFTFATAPTSGAVYYVTIVG